ncbi:hypothetical protein [Cupriavidus sp. D384]|uniref:hypothetical protein n=1 Tax=Cupriavidus sp. D384 TaxID=1538095 RepID=UPI000ACAA402|nr:hypothetical protein [Cupriavidus sp. D384]
MIWRPIHRGKVSLTEVKGGVADLVDLLKLNALLDAEEAAEAAAYKKAQSR